MHGFIISLLFFPQVNTTKFFGPKSGEQVYCPNIVNFTSIELASIGTCNLSITSCIYEDRMQFDIFESCSFPSPSTTTAEGMETTAEGRVWIRSEVFS